MRKLALSFGLIMASVSLTGCFMPEQVKTIEVQQVPANIQSDVQVEKAIMRAGKSLNWQMTLTDSQTVTGIYQTNTSRMTVSIPFTRTGYRILLKSSTNMSYSAEKGTINGTYNKRVTELDNAIQVNLYAL